MENIKECSSDKSTSIRKYSLFINDKHNNKTLYKYKNNKLDTTKYNFVSFIPKSLLFQFFRLANCYFLFIAIIQCISILSPLTPSTAIAPLGFVLVISMIREGIEDYARHIYDRLQNREKVIVYRDEEFKENTSDSLEIGELVMIKENQPFPADLVLLDSNLTDGMAYVETATLDGEKSLKIKISRKESSGFFYKDNGSVQKNQFIASGKFSCELPNPNLYELNGNLKLTLFEKSTNDLRDIEVSINEKQLLLKGSILKNTKWVIGFVLYAGKNTKIILNSQKGRVKFSRVEALMSRLILFIFILQIILCLICSLMHYSLSKESLFLKNYLYPYFHYKPALVILYSFLTFLLLMNTMIPISLIISLEIVKIIQGLFTKYDVKLYSHLKKKFAKAASISLNEELGQVNYIFTDKTGTLTCNKMEFKYYVIGNACYEYKRTFEGKYSILAERIPFFADEDFPVNAQDNRKKEIANLNFSINDKHSDEIQHRNSLNRNIAHANVKDYMIFSDTNPRTLIKFHDESELISEFWKSLSLNNDCRCNESEDKLEYLSISPDDIELVTTAAEHGFRLLKSSSNYLRRIEIGQEVKEFEVLKTIEFNSERKRMSIIVRDGQLIKLYIKGADSVLKEKLSKLNRRDIIENCCYYVDYFSGKGFRTLLVGMKIIDEEYFDDWVIRLNQAELTEDPHKFLVNELYEEIESHIYLIGATIVEDKLQDNVPETIQDLRTSGMKIWMLTGDKMDTAHNIGLSCNLISKHEKIFKISGEDGENLQDFMVNFGNFVNEEEESILNTRRKYSIILDSIALSSILSNSNVTDTFLTIASECVSVICCRVTPKQKSDVVRIIKKFKKDSVTLAIGDGGNDVSMITEAHIGIGIFGEEGLRAVQASDFSIGEFKFLRRLLLFHGRMNNMRISEMILFFFYKNFIFTIIHFYYSFYNECSGQTILDEWFISLYNLLFTAVPLIVRALSDIDVRPEDGKIVDKMLPLLYKENMDIPIFSVRNFLLNIISGSLYGLVAFYTVLISTWESSIDSKGNTADIWVTSANIFSILILIVSFRVIIVMKYFTWIFPVLMLLTSWIAYITYLMYAQYSDYSQSQSAIFITLSSGKFYLNLILPLVFTIVIDKAIYSYSINFSSTIYGAFMININERRKIDSIEDLSHKTRNIYERHFQPINRKEYVNPELIIVKRNKSQIMKQFESKQHAFYISDENLVEKSLSQSKDNLIFNDNGNLGLIDKSFKTKISLKGNKIRSTKILARSKSSQLEEPKINEK